MSQISVKKVSTFLDKITNFVELHYVIPSTECDMPDKTKKQVKWH